MKLLTLSIVIPVYNEESYLKSCLTAIANQSVPPDEVIVVDNNSTDSTAAIARQFDFVSIIHEPIQGLIAARNAGLNHATSTILARIDADTQLSPDWVERVHTIFSNPQVAAVTGPARTLTISYPWFPQTRLWSLVYFWATEAEFGIPVLWGANMALRQTAWKTIHKNASTNNNLVHEDQDLSYLLAGSNLRVVRDNNLTMSTKGQAYHGWSKFSEYTHRRFLTRRLHEKRGTLTSSTCRLSWWQRVPRGLAVIVPGIVFIITSLIMLPFSKIRVGGR